MPTPSLHDRWRTVLDARDIALAQILVNDTPVDHLFPGGDGVLSMMVMRGWREGVTLLLESGWNPLPDTDDNHAPLALAAGRAQDMALVRLLVEASAEPPARKKQDWQLWAKKLTPAIKMSLEHDFLEAVKFFQTRTSWPCETLVPHAVTPEGVRLAMDKEAGRDSLVLIDAVQQKRPLDFIRIILDSGVGFDYPSTDYSGDPVRKFVIDETFNRPDLFRMLVEYGAADDRPGLPALLLGGEGAYDGVNEVRLELLEIVLDRKPRFFEAHVLDFFTTVFQGYLIEKEDIIPLENILLPNLSRHPAIIEALGQTSPDFYGWMVDQHADKMTTVFLELFSSVSPCRTDAAGNTFFHTIASVERFQNVHRFLGGALGNKAPVGFLVEHFSQRGVDTRSLNNEGKRALDIALECRNFFVATALVHHQPHPADVQQLMVAASQPDDDGFDQTAHLPSLVCLLRDPEVLVDGLTLLHLALQDREEPGQAPDADYIKTLLNAGVPPDMGSFVNPLMPEGTTPLFLAMEHSILNTHCDALDDPTGDWATIALLLIDHGADPWKKRTDGKRPVDTHQWASQKGLDWMDEKEEVLALRQRIQIEGIQRKLEKKLPKPKGAQKELLGKQKRL